MSPIKLNGSTSGFVALDAPAAAGSNTLVLPTGNGTNGQVLTTNGSGALSWTTPSGGKILQVVQAVKTDTASTTSTSWSDISGLSVSITPTSASNKILVKYDCTLSATGSAYSGGIKLQRNGTDIFLGDAAGSRIRASNWFWSDYYNNSMWQVSNQYLDSPATTSSLTYKLQFISGYSGFTVYLNRNYVDSDNSNNGRVPSQITLMEVAA